MGGGNIGGINFASQPQHLAIEDKEILKDCAGCSTVIVGSFTGVQVGVNAKGKMHVFQYILDEPLFRKEAAFLRSNDTIELYDVSEGRFSFITKYEITTAKCLEMKSITIPWSKP